MDRISFESRSVLMGRIRRANTKPEMRVRRLLFSLGYRFRIQLKGVPGRPDIALLRRRKAIFIHGCFWHAHEGCSFAHTPKTRTDFWTRKFQRNKERDQRLLEAAANAGWKTLVIWECELSDTQRLAQHLCDFLGPPKTSEPIGHRSRQCHTS